ncbi:MAG: MarR family winged helix-turn-helix transcriptional regulator [Acutalibacteraceae bacterium]
MERKIGFEIGRCSRILKRYMDEKINRHYLEEMTGTHGWAVGYFYRNRDRDIFQKDFEKEFNIRRSTASSILSLMEKNGLIVRQSVSYDARLKKITLTQKALLKQEIVENAFNKIEEQLSEGISDEEITAFLNTLDKITANVERRQSDDDKKTE